MLWLVSLIAAQPTVAVLDFREPDQAEAWLPIRISDVLARRLSALGVTVRDRRFARDAARPKGRGLDALVYGRVRPGELDRESDALTVEVKLRTARERTLTARGRGSDIDRITTDLAAQIAAAVGVPVNAHARLRLGRHATHPFAVHRYLGRAARRLEGGSLLQAGVNFDQAASFAGRGVVPEAIEGRARAEDAKAALEGAVFGSRAELAASASERASVALRAGRVDEARRALADALKYTQERALRWDAPMHLGDPGRAVIVGRDKRWHVQIAPEPRGLLTLHPPTGVLLRESAGRAGLVGVAQDHLLLLEGRVLSRVDPAGKRLWKVALPLSSVTGIWDRVVFTEGTLGVWSDDRVAWVEVGLGGLGQVATQVKPIAAGSAGVLIRAKEGVALLRPGKKTPAWRAKSPKPEDAAVTSDRALVLAGGKLTILRAYNGEPTRALDAPAGGRIAGAHGRYACITESSAVTHVYDVLSAEKVSEPEGPGKAIDCHAGPSGVAILYDTGDLIFFSRDGKMLDRGRVPGRPERLLRGSPIAPGPVAVTDQGLFAFADLGAEPLVRDVEVMVRLAELESKHGDADTALRLADHVAHRSAGWVAKAEMIRAALLEKMKGPAFAEAALAARKRCEAAEHATTPLPAFTLAK